MRKSALRPVLFSTKVLRDILPVLALAVGTSGQDQQPIQDLSSLMGKQVIVQRLPLCQPGTYTVVLAYAGKQAKVLSVKPSSITHLSGTNLSRLTPAARAMMEDAQRAGTILFEFDDGTKLDTCAPIGPRKLTQYIELAPGQTVQPADPASSLNGGLTTTSSAIPRADLLSDDAVKLALTGSGREHWVKIEDMGLMAAQGNQVPRITLYMPEALLAIRFEPAKKQFRQYQPSEEDRRRSLTVIAHGYVGKTVGEGCTSITRVVLLSDPSGRVVQESYSSEPLSETWRNSFGAENQCQALRVKFSLDDVRRVRAAATDHEFFVAVFSGSANTKTYKIKKKHQSKLGLE